MKKIRWGILGLGTIAHEFAQAFQTDKAELVGAGSRAMQKAYDFSKRYDIPKAYGSYQELAYDPDIDIVYLATPNSHHKKDILMLLEAGKHVFCEKSITMNKKELDEVLLLANEKQLLVAEAMTIYHMPLYAKLKERIDNGEFGSLKMVHALFGSLKPDDSANRFFNPELGGGALLDIGVYALSFIRYFLSSQPSVRQTLVSMHPSGVDESSCFQFMNDAGEISTVSLAFRSKMPKQGVIICEDAYITIMNYPRADRALITYPSGEVETVHCGSQSAALSYEIDRLSETLMGKADFTSLQLTKDVNALMDWAACEWQMSNRPTADY
ncbi:oxidoreductase, Gfo/Idh/MocA family [Alkalibacterium sp. AK22]|uniref:Gfo/Idh/MocA family protein n=1 Tax=Alkalibacterium sp. AK22 TaxID=1229520 RepID=UPI00044556BB|nr:Gfo/Idh/MocA family oxidoreductase [Alkalibacterium sp. AK22]EXJ23001.1 oxidoreductase, Gfo/Idh/MocA family [Alkalibacterium sp. AK22]